MASTNILIRSCPTSFPNRKPKTGTEGLQPSPPVILQGVSLPFSQYFFYFSDGSCVENVFLFLPALPGNTHTVHDLIKAGSVMGIGVYGDHDPLLLCVLHVPP